jgi:hypothetical protein
LTDKSGIPISVVISSDNTHDIKVVTDVVDNIVIEQPILFILQKRFGERRGVSTTSIP